MTVAAGTFEVDITTRESSPEEGSGAISRMALAKTYSGDLAGTGMGQMLASMTAVQGSAGYVALETVEGQLAGRKGSFVLQHFGLMARGEASLKVTIVPDSGTGDLNGISGDLEIDIVDGVHNYSLTYEL
ncbi:MAG: DUF3224 domain-containing protein [Acidimicrobiia bacterium]|nr:DUF3224 domain-containing protein [Acidimicrobiia bacterium]